MATVEQGFVALMLLMFAQPLPSEEIIDQYLGKQYLLQMSKNYAKVLDVWCANPKFRKAALHYPSQETLIKSGNQYTYISKLPYIKTIETFTPNRPFYFTTGDGRNGISIVTIDGATLHEIQIEDNGRTVTINRTFSETQLKMTIKAGDVISQRTYRVAAEQGSHEAKQEQSKQTSTKPESWQRHGRRKQAKQGPDGAQPPNNEENDSRYIDQHLEKKYELIKSTKYDEILKALGVNWYYRANVQHEAVIDKLIKSDQIYTYVSKSQFGITIETFAPGVPFNFTTADDRNVTSTITIDGPTLHEVHVEANGRTTTIDRTFSDAQLATMIKVGPIVATKIYKLLTAKKQQPDEPQLSAKQHSKKAKSRKLRPKTPKRKNSKPVQSEPERAYRKKLCRRKFRRSKHRHWLRKRPLLD